MYRLDFCRTKDGSEYKTKKKPDYLLYTESLELDVRTSSFHKKLADFIRSEKNNRSLLIGELKSDCVNLSGPLFDQEKNKTLDGMRRKKYNFIQNQIRTLVLDFDDLPIDAVEGLSVQNSLRENGDAILNHIKIPTNVGYVIEASSSYEKKIQENKFNSHIIIPLKNKVGSWMIGNYLMSLNLTYFSDQIQLTKNAYSLKYSLDITTDQESRHIATTARNDYREGGLFELPIINPLNEQHDLQKKQLIYTLRQAEGITEELQTSEYRAYIKGKLQVHTHIANIGRDPQIEVVSESGDWIQAKCFGEQNPSYSFLNPQKTSPDNPLYGIMLNFKGETRFDIREFPSYFDSLGFSDAKENDSDMVDFETFNAVFENAGYATLQAEYKKFKKEMAKSSYKNCLMVHCDLQHNEEGLAVIDVDNNVFVPYFENEQGAEEDDTEEKSIYEKYFRVSKSTAQAKTFMNARVLDAKQDKVKNWVNNLIYNEKTGKPEVEFSPYEYQIFLENSTSEVNPTKKFFNINKTANKFNLMPFSFYVYKAQKIPKTLELKDITWKFLESYVPNMAVVIGNVLIPDFNKHYEKNDFEKMDMSVVRHWFNREAFILNERDNSKSSYIVTGAQGSGKGILTDDLIDHIYEEQFITFGTMTEFADKFNDNLIGKLRVLVDEIYIKGGERGEQSDLHHKSKSDITRKKISFEKKHLSKRTFKNIINRDHNSNVDSPISFNDGKRRYTQVSAKKSLEDLWFPDLSSQNEKRYMAKKKFNSDVFPEFDDVFLIIASLKYNKNLAETGLDTKSSEHTVELRKSPHKAFSDAFCGDKIDLYFLASYYNDSNNVRESMKSPSDEYLEEKISDFFNAKNPPALTFRKKELKLIYDRLTNSKIQLKLISDMMKIKEDKGFYSSQNGYEFTYDKEIFDDIKNEFFQNKTTQKNENYLNIGE